MAQQPSKKVDGGEKGVSAPSPQSDIPPVIKRRGGKRPGAGRPKGARNKRTEERVQQNLVKGKLPLEYMLDVMRNGSIPKERRDKMAIAAAPYLHPRLATHEVSGKGGGEIKFSGFATVAFYVPENGRRVAPADPANDAPQSVVKHKGNGHGGNGSSELAA